MNKLCSIFLFVCYVNFLTAQKNLPLKFSNNESKWSNLYWVENEHENLQYFDNRVPPIIVDDTIYTFTNYNGNGISTGYSGYSIKKINLKTGETIWNVQDINKMKGERKAISYAFLNESTIDVVLFDEAPPRINQGSLWNDCYPGSMEIERQSGIIVKSNYVDKENSSILSDRFGIEERETGVSNVYTLTENVYRIINYDFNYNLVKYIDNAGVMIKTDTMITPLKYIKNSDRFFPIQDSLIGSFIHTNDITYVNNELIYTLLDKDLNVISRTDLTPHLDDTLSFCVAFRVDHDHIIVESGFQDFFSGKLKVDYHLFNIEGQLIDKIEYTFKPGIDNGTYGHFYPLMDVVNNRILLTRSIQKTVLDTTNFEIFASDGEGIKLVKSIKVDGIEDHFRTRYATMMDNGDILIYAGQFYRSFQNVKWFSWIMLDGEKLNIITNTHESNSQSFLKIYPNPTMNILRIDNLNSPAKITIRNVNGSQVMDFDNVSNEIDISELSSGLYFLSVQNKELFIQQKLLKIDR